MVQRLSDPWHSLVQLRFLLACFRLGIVDGEYTGDVEPEMDVALEEISVCFGDEGTLEHAGAVGKMKLEHMAAGFDVEVATVSGNPAKLEFWAMPREDDTVMGTYDRIKSKLKAPRKLSEVVQTELGEDSDYLAVFIPGGHGPLIGIPESPDVAKVLNWALDTDRFIITLCHGPAGLLAAGIGQEKSPFAGYSTCVFPDALDKGPNQDMGYLPGPLPWALGERLAAQGLNVLNTEMTGQVHRDRQLLSGDSPLAANALGHLAADVLVEAVANR